jgi:hypothetical protein
MASSAQAKQFIETIGPIIQEEAKARGYKVCSPIIAQACIESGYNTSLLSMKYHNYFGMKCGSVWKGPSVNMATKEEYNSQLVNIRDNFRCYPDIITGVKGYFDFISTKRYENLKSATTPKEYLELIKKDGYATSSSYVSTCMNVVTRYGLESFDFGVYKPITPELILEIVNGDWGDGAVRRTKLTASGYNYDDVRAKVNALNKIGKEFIPEIKDRAGDYWLSVVKLMAL